MESPKVFISYSWTNADHESWVVNLATQLRENGVDAILDKWDLKEGQDANTFMESMVSEKSIQKVLIIADKAYVEKSNARAGGAGTEAQIISQQLYTSQTQGKFVVLALDRDESEKVILPIYYASRIFIDYTISADKVESFERLLRWIHDKPLYVKPEVGVIPHYISSNANAVKIGTSGSQQRAVAFLRDGKVNALAACDEYLEKFSVELEKFRLPPDFDPVSDAFLNNLSDFSPYKDEYINFLLELARYGGDDFGLILAKFFEKMLPYFHTRRIDGSYRDIDADNFLFFGRELYLSTAAVLIKQRKIKPFEDFIGYSYYDAEAASRRNSGVVGFGEFCNDIKSLRIRNDSLKLRRVSIEVDLLKSRSESRQGFFVDLMQADLCIFLRTHFLGGYWWPTTLAFATDFYGAFEIFDRAQKKKDFQILKRILGFDNKSDLDNLIENIKQRKVKVPSDSWSRVDIPTLMGSDRLDSVP